MGKSIVTQQTVKDTFHYRDGDLYWKQNGSGRRKDLSIPAGCIDTTSGYRVITFEYKMYLAHTLIWIYHYGHKKAGTHIDHIDRNSLNNRIENLRQATVSENARNKGIVSNNTSGHTGVSKIGRNKNRWRASITVDGRIYNLGTYIDINDAIEARRKAEKDYNYNVGVVRKN